MGYIGEVDAAGGSVGSPRRGTGVEGAATATDMGRIVRERDELRDLDRRRRQVCSR
jgi:hypothetical protein